jgi:NADP-dependent 3-hydroxy acid dehydrogenase YdfG
MQNLFSLEGRVAVVTGGSRGIGAMIAKGFLVYGAKRVYITARKAAACDAAAEELSQYGDCVSLPGDVSTMEGIEGLTARLLAAEPKLDILVNNAGAAWGAAFDEFPESGWDKVVDLNMKTPFFLTQALIGPLRAAAKDHVAKVINICSIDGQTVAKEETYPYGASKAGLLHMTKRMALRLAPENIQGPAAGLERSRSARSGPCSPSCHAARDPVAQVDVGQLGQGGLDHVVEDDEGAQAAARRGRVVEAVDQRQAVGEDVDQHAGDQVAGAAVLRGQAVFDDVGADRRVLDHGHIVGPGHVGHAALGVAGQQVATQQLELLHRRLALDEVALEILVAGQHPALGAREDIVGHRQAGRHAGRQLSQAGR